MISEGTGIQALSKAIRKKTPKYPAEEMVFIIKDASQDINSEIINYQFTIFNQLINFQFRH
jgi:hypothetical protein